MKTIKRIFRGMGYLEGYGHHPGNMLMITMILMCAVTGGMNGGLRGFFSGMGIVLIGMLPMYIHGCYARSVDYEADMERTFNILATDAKKQQQENS